MTGHELDMSHFPDRELDDDAQLLDRWLRATDEAEETDLGTLDEAWERGLQSIRDQVAATHAATPRPVAEFGQVIPLRPTRRRFRLASLAAAATAIVTLATVVTRTNQPVEQSDVALPGTTSTTASIVSGPSGPPPTTTPTPTSTRALPPAAPTTTTPLPAALSTTTSRPRSAATVTLAYETDGTVRITLVQPLPPLAEGQVYRASVTTPGDADPIEIGTSAGGPNTSITAQADLETHPILVITRETTGATAAGGPRVLTVDLRTAPGWRP